MSRRMLGAVCGVLMVASAGGCSDEQSPPPTTSSGRPPDVPALRARPLDTLRGLRRAVRERDCPAVNRLVHSDYGPSRSRFCADLASQLAALPPTAAVVRRGTGAVVEFTDRTGRRRALVLAMDTNGRYRIVFVATIRRTLPEPEGDGAGAAARAAVRAIAAGDCASFARVASRTVGIGDGPSEEVCVALSQLEIVSYLQSDPAARPEFQGGDEQFAFYVVRVGRRAGALRGVFTVILQRGDGGRPNAPAQWRLVTVVQS